MSLARIDRSALQSRRQRAVENSSGPRGIQAGWTIEAPTQDTSRVGLQKKNWDFLPARLRKKIQRAGNSYSEDPQMTLAL